jgi:hypothetical protein
MDIFIIVCKLKAKDSYEIVSEAIKILGDAWWHCDEPTWLLRSSLKPHEIRSKLACHLGGDDQLLILACREHGEWQGFGDIPCMWLEAVFNRAAA